MSLPVFRAAVLASAAFALQSDNDCLCAVTRSNSINSSALASAGCRLQADGSRACLTEFGASATPCGTFVINVGYIDTCTNAAISAFTLQQSERLEWDQSPFEFYTLQTMSFSWQVTNSIPNENLVIRASIPSTQGQNGGPLLRVVLGNLNSSTTTSATHLVQSNLAVVGGGSTSWLGAGTTIFIHPQACTNSQSCQAVWTSPQQQGALYWHSQVNASIPAAITISSSRIVIEPLVETSTGRILNSTTPAIQAGMNVTLRFRCFGMAQRGALTITFRRGSGGSAITFNTMELPAQANVTAVFTLDSSAITAANNYNFFIVAQLPNLPQGVQTPTGTSPSFQVVAPSPSPSPTSSSTPTPSTTISATPTPTSTTSASGTPSVTPGLLEAAARRIAEANKSDNTTVLVGAIIGTAVVMLLGFVGYQVWARRKASQDRLKKLRETARMSQGGDKMGIYGVASSSSGAMSGTVVYQVNMPPSATAGVKSAYGPASVGMGPAGRVPSSKKLTSGARV